MGIQFEEYQNQTLTEIAEEARMELMEGRIGSAIIIGLVGALALVMPRVHGSAKDMVSRITQHEGYEYTSYKDRGKRAIGIGFNLDENSSIAKPYFNKQGLSYDDVYAGKVKITDAQIKDLFELSLSEIKKIANSYIPGLDKHPQIVQEVIIEMCFQLGNRIHGFKDTKALILKRDYVAASKEMLNSNWARAHTNRSRTLSDLMKSAKN